MRPGARTHRRRNRAISCGSPDGLLIPPCRAEEGTLLVVMVVELPGEHNYGESRWAPALGLLRKFRAMAVIKLFGTGLGRTCRDVTVQFLACRPSMRGRVLRDGHDPGLRRVCRAGPAVQASGGPGRHQQVAAELAAGHPGSGPEAGRISRRQPRRKRRATQTVSYMVSGLLNRAWAVDSETGMLRTTCGSRSRCYRTAGAGASAGRPGGDIDEESDSPRSCTYWSAVDASALR